MSQKVGFTDAGIFLPVVGQKIMQFYRRGASISEACFWLRIWRITFTGVFTDAGIVLPDAGKIIPARAWASDFLFMFRLAGIFLPARG